MKQTILTIGLLAICYLLAGCILPFQNVATHSSVLDLPIGNYMDIAWYAPEQLALSYTDSPDVLAIEEYRVVIDQIDLHHNRPNVVLFGQCGLLDYLKEDWALPGYVDSLQNMHPIDTLRFLPMIRNRKDWK